MLQVVSEWGPSLWAAVKPHLHDLTPVDLAISGFFLITLAALALAVLRRGAPLADRVRWAGLTAVVAGLLLNQQSDLHTRALQAARSAVQGLGEAAGPTMDLLQPFSFLIAVIAIVTTILAFTATGHPPGPVAGCGLLLLLVHAAGRGATFIGLAGLPSDSVRLHLALEVIEVLGLLLILIAAVRYRPPARPAVPERAPAAVAA